MADLHVTDTIIAAAQHGFTSATGHLDPIAGQVRSLDAATAGVNALASRLDDIRTQFAADLTTTRESLTRLASDVGTAAMTFDNTDQALGRAARGTTP